MSTPLLPIADRGQLASIFAARRGAFRPTSGCQASRLGREDALPSLASDAA